jgi:NAD-dependent DNA ligase
LKILQEVGFSVVKYKKTDSIDTSDLTDLLTTFKASSEYEIDGIIVHANEEYDRNTSGNPDYMFAFKMLSGNAIFETTVLGIEWNVSKWGQLKPVVLIEPVECNGVTMQRVTAHNAKYVEENNLGEGAVIKVTRSKDVIPYIVSVVEQAESPDMPTEEYTWDENHVNISVKEHVDVMCIKLISGFFAKLGIKFVSEATVDKLFKGGLNNLLKIVGASKKRLLEIFQEKTAERIYTNIHNGLQNIKLPTLLGASGVFGFGIGTRRMEALLLDIPDLFQVYKGKSRKELLNMVTNVEGFSDIMAEKVVDNLKYGDLFIQKMSKYITVKTQERVSSSMKGHKYVMSGFRDKKIEEEITKRGGKVTGTVSKNTTGLILQNKSGKLTGKPLKAQELGVPIYSKEEFVEKFF